jgi:glycosyltransferase involved in cell wall biosynthesis
MKRILFAIPIPYGPDWGFWTRDSGLVVLALRKMGYDAWLVALGDASTVTTDRPVLPVSLETMKSADWWKAQRPDAVVLNTWSAPRYDAIRRAALSATPRVVERLDTSGANSARLFPKAHFVGSWGRQTEKLPAYARCLAPVLAAARTALLYSFPGLMDARMVATMRQLPAVIVETPVAAARIGQMFKIFSGSNHRVAMIPHPVNDGAMHYDRTPKENRIITVGRWASWQKDFPLLRKVLKGFLQRHPDWRATVVGSGVPARDRAAGNGSEEWRQRITYHEKLTHEQLAGEYNKSKIYLMVSRYESFCIAAGEALCCGCSVVGSSAVPSSYYFAETQSGHVAETRTAKAFLNTLDQEVGCWINGERNPEAIASVSRKRMGSHAVAQTTLALLENILPGDPLPIGEQTS